MFAFMKKAFKSVANYGCLDDMNFVADFNYQLGQDLGGVVGVFDAFQDSESLWSSLVMLIKSDMEMSKKGILNAEERSSVLRDSVCGLGATDQMILTRYFDFFAEAVCRIRENNSFAFKINQDNPHTIMPDIFTFEVLKLACKVAGKLS